MPLKVNDFNTLKPLLYCLNYLKLWMSFNFLNLNESKTEIVVFSSSDGYDIQNLNLELAFINGCKKPWCAI